jgi:hypothetical protein
LDLKLGKYDLERPFFSSEKIKSDSFVKSDEEDNEVSEKIE